MWKEYLNPWKWPGEGLIMYHIILPWYRKPGESLDPPKHEHFDKQ